MGVLRGSYASITRRLEAAEQRAAQVRAGGPGCATCEAWTPNCVFEANDAARGVPGSSLAARYGAQTHERGGWPPGAQCPDCGRQPAATIRIVYVDMGPHEAMG